ATFRWHPGLQVRFSDVQPLRGVSGITAEVRTAMGESACGYGFHRGQYYLVYAYRDPQTGRLSVSSCSRTRLLSNAAEDLAYFRAVPQEPPGSAMRLKVSRSSRDPVDLEKYSHGPLPALKLIVDGPSGHLEAATGTSGAHEFSGLPPGHYKVHAEIPERLASFSQLELDVYDRGCAEVEFSSRFNGQIRGTVSGLKDHALEAAKIDIIPASGKGASTFSYLGRYEMTYLPPGRYLLGI